MSRLFIGANLLALVLSFAAPGIAKAQEMEMEHSSTSLETARPGGHKHHGKHHRPKKHKRKHGHKKHHRGHHRRRG